MSCFIHPLMTTTARRSLLHRDRSIIRNPSTPAPPSSVPCHEEVNQEARGSEQVACRKSIEEGHSLMKQRYQPYKQHQALPPLELRFSMKSLGCSSSTDIGFEDVVEDSLTSSLSCDGMRKRELQ